MKVYGYKLSVVPTKKCLEIHPNFPVQETVYGLVNIPLITDLDKKAYGFPTYKEAETSRAMMVGHLYVKDSITLARKEYFTTEIGDIVELDVE